MEQTSQQQLQSKADAIIPCLEFIKLNIKSNSEFGRIANGKNKIAKWLCRLHKLTPIWVNVAFWIFILYIILF